MANYTNRDIQSSFEGDILVSSNGDLELSNALDTYKAASNFVLRTDYGDYAPDGNVGCNLGSFIGELNIPKIHEAMEYNINKTLRNEVFSETDVTSTVVPFDTNEALAIIDIAGSFLIDGEFIQVENDRIAYTFPYIGSKPSPIKL